MVLLLTGSAMAAPIEHLLLNTFSNVKLAYIERVNNTYAEALIAFLVLIAYVHYKLRFWTWHGVPNDVHSLVAKMTTPYHVADADSYRKHGKVVG